MNTLREHKEGIGYIQNEAPAQKPELQSMVTRESFEQSLKESPWLLEVYKIIDEGTHVITETDGTKVVNLEEAEQAELVAFKYLLNLAQQWQVPVIFNSESSYTWADSIAPELHLGFDKPETPEKKEPNDLFMYQKLSEFIHEMIHMDDFLNGRYDPDDDISRKRTEAKAYPHTYNPTSYSETAMVARAKYVVEGYSYSTRFTN